jgi:hypothetical protein
LEIILASAARLRSWRNSGKVPRPARGMISPFWVFFFIQEVEIFFLWGVKGRENFKREREDAVLKHSISI